MRTTIQIDDSLLRELKEEAHREGLSLTKLVNRVLRYGMNGLRQRKKAKSPYREKTFLMGEPKLNIDKALSLAAMLEDQEIIDKLARRK